ncbi:sensor histidine kinase [Roseivirga sp.]|uniref:sensor histidine kinase n=1 Tax=Roseivirga sp. TaxID=1964215 RepID=UPI003B51E8E5
MDFKHFRVQLVLRTLGILIATLALAWSIYETEFLMTPIVFGLLMLIQVFLLISYVEKGNKQVNHFLHSFFDKDYTRKFTPQFSGKVFQQVADSLNQIMEDYAQLNLEKEEYYQYVRQVNEHVEVALISFKSDGRIDLMNKSAQHLLRSPLLYNIDAIRNYDQGLLQVIKGLKTGERQLYKTRLGGDEMNLALVAKKFKLSEKEYTLVALQDIRQELQQNEIDAWQKLIRVLTHEIMNSMTPVLSLTTAIKQMVDDEGGPKAVESIVQEEVNDIHRSISAIEKRGEGLLNFVNAYRNYTRLPELKLEEVSLSEIVEQAVTLVNKEFSTSGVNLKFESSVLAGDRAIMVDSKLISQVLLNLLKNAREAVSGIENPLVSIRLSCETAGLVVTVSDNGHGVPEHLRDDIFVPFFTTKEQGTGIGLSLSRQIIKAHGGDLKLLESEEGSRFEVRMAFNA